MIQKRIMSYFKRILEKEEKKEIDLIKSQIICLKFERFFFCLQKIVFDRRKRYLIKAFYAISRKSSITKALNEVLGLEVFRLRQKIENLYSVVNRLKSVKLHRSILTIRSFGYSNNDSSGLRLLINSKSPSLIMNNKSFNNILSPSSNLKFSNKPIKEERNLIEENNYLEQRILSTESYIDLFMKKVSTQILKLDLN